MAFPALPDISFHWRDAIDIALVAFLFYQISTLARKTRATAALYGLLMLVVIYFIANGLKFFTLSWLLEYMFSSLLLLVIIVFQQDIRHGLSYIGSRRWWLTRFFQRKHDLSHLEIIADAAGHLAVRNIGALIVLERNVPLSTVGERGIAINANISKELLVNLFWPNSPLHDGAVLIRRNSIVAASCILPLSAANTESDYGTRHRAAMGITEESDAVVVGVSEERGVISLAIEGRITGALSAEKLKRV
ncbi:MAG: diadenylate cyclase CdaA, partial [Candidatus Adiutrix sp.]